MNVFYHFYKEDKSVGLGENLKETYHGYYPLQIGHISRHPKSTTS